jgi:hypothetical protein
MARESVQWTSLNRQHRVAHCGERRQLPPQPKPTRLPTVSTGRTDALAPVSMVSRKAADAGS